MVQSKLLLQYPEVSHSFCGIEGTSGSYVISTQVHGNSVRLVTKKEARNVQADAMVTTKYFGLAIHTADCLPILLYDSRLRIAGALHAGWRGLLSGIIQNTISTFGSLGSNSQTIIAAIGPSIGVCCYEIQLNLAEQFLKQGYTEQSILEKRSNRWYLNLQQIAVQQMIKIGMEKENIDIIPVCTKDNDTYFSYRRGIKSGQRNISFIQIV